MKIVNYSIVFRKYLDIWTSSILKFCKDLVDKSIELLSNFESELNNVLHVFSKRSNEGNFSSKGIYPVKSLTTSVGYAFIESMILEICSLNWDL